MRTLLLAAIAMGSALGCASTPPGGEPSTSAGAATGAAGSAAGQVGAGGALGAGAGGVFAVGGGGAGTGAGGLAAGGAAATTGGAAGTTGGGAGTGGTGGSGGVESDAGAGAGGALSAGAGGAASAGAGGAVATGGAGNGGSTTGGSGGALSGGMSGSAGNAAGGGSGGGGSGGAGSGGGGGAAYQPCPTAPCKILPLGDSITWGVGDEPNAGYRGPLFGLAVAAGREVTFTGSLTNGPTTVSGQSFPQKNEGHSGWGISRVTPYSNGNAGIATRIPSPALSSGSGGLPNIILLHIGTNDQGSFTAGQMTSDLAGLIDQLIANAPDAYVVVAQIIPLGYGTNDVIRTYNQSIPGLVQERSAAGKHIAVVDMFTGFDAGTMLGSDDIHPNTAGYSFMANRWYSAVGTLLPY